MPTVWNWFSVKFKDLFFPQTAKVKYLKMLSACERAVAVLLQYIVWIATLLVCIHKTERKRSGHATRWKGAQYNSVYTAMCLKGWNNISSIIFICHRRESSQFECLSICSPPGILEWVYWWIPEENSILKKVGQRVEKYKIFCYIFIYNIYSYTVYIVPIPMA